MSKENISEPCEKCGTHYPEGTEQEMAIIMDGMCIPCAWQYGLDLFDDKGYYRYIIEPDTADS